MRTLAANSTRVLLLPWCALVAACTGGGSEPAVERFDEGGVEVVLSQRPAWGDAAGWRLSAEPNVVIGENTDDSRYLFSAIYGGRFLGPGGLGPVRLPDGQIVAGDQGSTEVRFFGASGELVRVAVGQGEGPTELTSLNQLHHCVPGSVIAIDNGLGLLAVIDSAGEFRGRFFFEDNAGKALYTPITCNRNGQLLAMDWGNELRTPGQEELGLYRSRVHMWVLDPEGFVLRDLGEFPGVERLGTPRGSGPHPLGKTPARALGTDHAYIGTADDFEIEVWTLDGVLHQRWRRSVDDLTVHEDDVDAYLDIEAPETNIAEELADMRRRFNPLPLPETYPAYTRFVLDATDHLWVENFRTPRRIRHLWSVFDPDGVWLGEVEVPPTFEITDIGEDYVLGVFRDDLDEQSIRLYGLLRD